MTIIRRLPPVVVAIAIAAVLVVPSVWAARQPTVRVEPPTVQGPRALEDQTATAVVRDYLESWQSMSAALAQNRVALLDPDFVGTARDKLAATVRQQARLGIRTRYLDRAHDLRIVFYSPDGLSIQMIDNVEYQEKVFQHEKILATRQVRARYVVVMTPAELRWRVRIFQAEPD